MPQEVLFNEGLYNRVRWAVQLRQKTQTKTLQRNMKMERVDLKQNNYLVGEIDPADW